MPSPTQPIDVPCGKSEHRDTEEEQGEGPRSWQRFYMGYHERFVDDCVLPLQNGDIEVRLAQAPSARAAQKKRSRNSATLDKAADPALTGTTVWDGAVVLSHLLADTDILQQHAAHWAAANRAAQSPTSHNNDDQDASMDTQGQQPCEPPCCPTSGAQPVNNADNGNLTQISTADNEVRCIELGAGTGGVSLSLLACRRVSSCDITDLPDLVPHLQLNVSRNAHLIPSTCQAHIKALRWGPPGDDLPGPDAPPYHLIVGSDLIYYTYSEETPHSKLLLWTLQRLARPFTVIYLSLSLHHNPEEVEHFLQLAEHGGFAVQRLSKEIPLRWRVPDVLVVRLRVKELQKPDKT